MKELNEIIEQVIKNPEPQQPKAEKEPEKKQVKEATKQEIDEVMEYLKI